MEDELYEKYPSLSKTKYRFHVLGVPHTITRKDYCVCAFTMKVLKFCTMMKKRGHYILHYGHEESEVECDEHITLTTNEDLTKTYGDYNWKKEFFKHSCNNHCSDQFNTKGTDEVLKRIQKKDFVLPFWGIGVKAIVDAVIKDGRGLVVEPGIGYPQPFCKFRIYESYAFLHNMLGREKTNPSWYHTVIPNYFNVKDFDYSDNKDDYYLYLGRISTCKGTQVIIDIAIKSNIKLIIAGQGDIDKNLHIDSSKLPSNIKYVGYADIEKRKNLMKNAKALLIMSNYVEPFGGVAVEAMMSGTPVITPNWGAFTETVIHGVTGYRCTTFEQISWAIKNISNIKPKDCREWAVNNYSCAKVSTMYEEFFSQLYNLWEEGWYKPNTERNNLDWLCKDYPLNN